jgi:uncharacterized repeat protein (TIGR01451 family)
MKLAKYAIFATLAIFATPSFAVDVLVSRLTDTPDPAVRGGEITYTIDVQNQQADIASNVVLTFSLPATTEFVAVDNGACSHDGATPGQVSCSYGDMLGTAAVPAGPVETANVVIRTTAASGSTIAVEATAVTDSADTNAGNNILTQNTTIDDGADLTTVYISALPSPVIAGGDVIYTNRISNNGPNAAIAVEIVFTLSINMTYVSGSAAGAGWTCSYDAGPRELTCTRGSLGVGEVVADIVFAGKVTGAEAGTLTNIAEVSATTSDPVPNNNVTSVNVTVVPGADLTVGVSAEPSTVISGEALSLTLTPRNLGPFDANNVVVISTVPDDFVIGIPSGPGWSCSVSLQVVTCSRPLYAVGATDNITIPLTAPVVTVLTDVTSPVTISTDPGGEAAERLGNNSDSTTIRVTPDGVDLSVTKSKSPQPVAQGSPITSVITVSNGGPQNAAIGTITLTDTLDPGEGYTGFSGSNWSCVDSTPDIICTYNAVLNSGSTSSSLTINTTAVAAIELTNTASVSYSGDPGDYDSSNDSVTASVTSTAAIADLILTKTADAGSVDGDTGTLAADPGPPEILENTIIYTLTITNNGPAAADGIVLTDPIPGYVSGGTAVTMTSQPSNYTCTTGATVTCTQLSGSLANGDSDGFVITVTRPLFDGSNTNNATAYSSTVGDNDRDNNRASATVVVEAVADVTVQAKSVTPDTVKSGVEATYLITIRNNGPSTAQNVQVIDTFTLAGGDPGFTFISGSASGGGSCTGLAPGGSYIAADSPTFTCDWGSLSRLQTETIELVIRPNFMATPPEPRTMDNSVTISTSTLDSNGANNALGPITLTIIQDDIDLLINNSDTPDPVAWDPASGGDNPNNEVVYDVEFTNRGPSYATGVSFEYTMTPKAGKTVRFDCDEAGSGDACGTSADTCLVAGGSNPVTGPSTLTLTCTATTVAGKLDEMTASSSGHRYLHFMVLTEPDGTGDTHETNATISANENETILANNSESETTSVRGRVDLEITSKTPIPSEVQLDQPFLWTITVTNNGPVVSDQTDLSDSLPAGMIFHGAAPSWANATDATGGPCSVDGSNLSCDLGTMSVDATAEITIPVMMDAFTTASLDNCATAITNGVDVIPENNTDICGTVTVSNSFFPSDYGDAPDGSAGTGPGDYATTLDNGGPRHLEPGGTWLGACVDADGDGTQQDIDASADDSGAGPVEAGTCVDGDDEDGVKLPPALIAGLEAEIELSISGSTCALDGWFDFNADGDFDDAGEQVFSALSLAAGIHVQTFVAPADLIIGDSYARFRCSTGGGLTPTEEVSGGEVEDYLVSLQPDGDADGTPVDYGDNPDPAIGTATGDYQTLALDNGPSHVLGVSDAPYLGACVDSDPQTQQSTGADADDLGAAGGGTSPLTTGTCATANDDEDGVLFASVLEQGSTASIDVTASSGTNACLLNAWIDYDANGDFSDPGEQIAVDLTIASGDTVTLNPSIPTDVSIGTTYTRFRCSSSGGLKSTGAATDGEVEDYLVSIRPNLSLTPVDFGDAPDIGAGEANGDYTTTEINNGPSHVLLPGASPYLGACVDSDDGTAQNTAADADDLAPAAGVNLTIGACAVAGQDEDGVALPEEFFQGDEATIDVTTGPASGCVLNAWIDFDQNGSFSDLDERILVDEVQAAGTTRTYPVTTPSQAEIGQTYARFRCSTEGGLTPDGPAPDGEVEDYLVTVSRGIASFVVSKVFSDGNVGDVEVSLSCNDGFVNASTAVITGGDPNGFRFVVRDFISGALNCEIMETPVPGYQAEYSSMDVVSGISCDYLAVEGGAENFCVITNTLLPVPVTIDTVWELVDDPADIPLESVVRLVCENVAGGQSEWEWFIQGNQTNTALVLPRFDGTTRCVVDQQSASSAIESSGCENPIVVTINASESGCMLVNTAFFEGIPTLNRFGLLLLISLMLGVGFVGFRRYA